MSQLIRQEGPALRAFAYGLTRNAADAEDLAQETFLKVAQNWPRYDKTRNFRSWGCTVLKNRFLDERRSYEAKNVVSLEAPVIDDGPDLRTVISDSQEGIEAVLERRETVEMVRRTLKRMPIGHREVLTLCDLKGVPYEEAARTIGVPLNTLRSRLHRARLAFRQQFPDPSYV